MTTTGTRLPPADPEHWNDATRRLLGDTVAPVANLEGGTSTGGGPLNILRTIAHHPTLLEPFLAFAATLATRGVLSRRASELLALRAAWKCHSAFEWAHHVVYARAAGLDDSEIERIADGHDAPGWSDEERWLLVAVDELVDGHDLRDETWNALRERFAPAQLVEIPFVVGQYTMLSMVANATGVAVEAGLPALPERRPGGR
jgi:4-carboxymuconolactone decarboxylase